jgi:hypothetical protein
MEGVLKKLANKFALDPLENVAERLAELQHRYQPLIQQAPPRPPLGTELTLMRQRARERLRPGDAVIWEKSIGGGFTKPIKATVIALRAKRVTIAAEDPDETGAGVVTRHVDPTSLYLQERVPADPRPRRPVSGERRPRTT